MLNKRFAVITVVSLTLFGAGPALAQKIHAGSASGSYTNDFCPEVEQALKAQYFEHSCTTSQGTGDNVEKVLAAPTDVGLGQFDIVALRAEENPGQMIFVNPNIGLECLYAITADSSITALKGLSPRMPVALPSEKSGSAATFQYLQTLDDSLAQLRRITHFGSALEAVQAVIDGKAAVAFFVQFANTKNKVFETINDAELSFVPVINRKILRREASGIRVYQPQEVVVTPPGLLGRLTGKDADKVVTTCTPVVLFTGDPANITEGTAREDQEDVVKQLTKVQPPSKGDWTDVFKNTVAVGKEKLNELMGE